MRQLRKILLAAAEAPGTVPDIVAARVEAESRQSSIQDSFEFTIDGREAHRERHRSRILQKSVDLSERRKAWEASKEIGKPLRAGLVELQRLRNAVAREMGLSSFHALQVADYDMTVKEMADLLDGFVRDTKPLYDELHLWTRRHLAKRYGAPVPEGSIPAHWINNRWSQNWTGIVEAADLDPYFAGREPSWIVKTSEAFYTSMGFEPLPESFWKKSDLYPVSPGESRKKNSHASAWHVDVERDVRSLMSVEPDERWFSTSHHELGHIYYYSPGFRRRLGSAPIDKMMALATYSSSPMKTRWTPPSESSIRSASSVMNRVPNFSAWARNSFIISGPMIPSGWAG